MKLVIKTIAIMLSAAVIASMIPSFAVFADEEPENQLSVQQEEVLIPNEQTEEVLTPPVSEELITSEEPETVQLVENVAETPEENSTDGSEYEQVEPHVSIFTTKTTATAPKLAAIQAETPFDNSTTLEDGTYEISESDFVFRGGTGKAKLTLKEVVVKDKKATAVFTASSANMTHAYIGTVESDAEDLSIFDPSTGEHGVNVYEIANQTVTLPVRVNEEVALAARTTAMTEPHWIQYYYTITVNEDETPDDPDQKADYTAVDAALAKIPADLSIYTDESVAALKTARDAVVRDKAASEQAAVAAMAKAIEDAIAALVEKPVEDGKIDLSITNNTGMFKAVSAYLETVDNKTTLVVALSGSGYHELFKGTYEQAVANGDNRTAWVHGKTNAEGLWEFRIPVNSGETYIPMVAISNTYVEKYEKGQNSLARAFFPRQFILNTDNKTLVTGDYEYQQSLEITNNVTMFKPETAVLETVGGPNSNNYKSNLLLTMGSDSFDKVCYGTKEEAPTSEAVYDINGRTFTIPIRWVEIFGQPETMQTIIGSTVTFSFHSVRKNEWYERKLTINEENGTLVIDEVKDGDSSDDGAKPPIPTPTPGGNGGNKKDYEDTTGGSIGAVDNTTSLADGVYTPDKFSFSGGTGKIAITCTKVEVKGGKAYATIVFRNTKSGTTEVGYVKASGGTYYCTQSGGTSVVTIPVELNKNNTILAMTTKMSAAHEIAYTIFVYIAGADAQKGSALTANTELDKEAPVIAGLEYQDEEEIESAEYFKVFNYSDGIRLLEVDMRLRKEDQKNDDNDEQSNADTEETLEEEAQEESEEDAVKTIIDEETGMEITLVASKAEAQAELYKGNVIKYLLVPEDVEIPAGLDKETIVITMPVEHVYSGDKEITDTMKDLKVDNLINSQPEEDKDNKEIQAAGDYKDLDYKALVKSKCDVVLLPENSVKDKKERENFNSVAEDLANLDIAVIVDRAAYEKTDNAKAEWLKVYGILFGCEQEAKDAFNKIKK